MYNSHSYLDISSDYLYLRVHNGTQTIAIQSVNVCDHEKFIAAG